MSDPVEKLREEYRAAQDAGYQEAALRQQRNRRNVTAAGAVTGFVAVVCTAAVTRKAIVWHSFLLEALFCAAAGYALARLHGGFLKGVLFFSGAYLGAHLVRLAGLDPAVLFYSGDMRIVAAAQGNFMSLCIVLTCGGLIGHIISSE